MEIFPIQAEEEIQPIIYSRDGKKLIKKDGIGMKPFNQNRIHKENKTTEAFKLN
jgi:hypothetical protein